MNAGRVKMINDGRLAAIYKEYGTVIERKNEVQIRIKKISDASRLLKIILGKK
jgi:hypothetical protein